MRKDMSKVVIERPRHGHSLPSRRTSLRIRHYDIDHDYDDLPKRVSGSRNKHIQAASVWEIKYFSDLLGPLRRFLRSNVGRPWDKIYSELSQNLDKRKTTGIHVFEHLEWEVSLNCYIGKDGKVYTRRAYRKPQSADGFYVHPRTGLLCWIDPNLKWKAERENRKAEEKARNSWRVAINGKRHYVKLNGIWYVADIEPYNRSQQPPEVEGKMTLIDEQRERFIVTWRVTNKRQCNGKELKTAGLSNDRPA